MSSPIGTYPRPGCVYNHGLKDWQPFAEAPEELVRRHRVASVPLQADELLGLLKGTLRVDPNGPQLSPDAELFMFCDGDALNRQPGTERRADGTLKDGKGVYLGVRASTLPPVDEGGMMPLLQVRFIPCG